MYLFFQVSRLPIAFSSIMAFRVCLVLCWQTVRWWEWMAAVRWEKHSTDNVWFLVFFILFPSLWLVIWHQTSANIGWILHGFKLCLHTIVAETTDLSKTAITASQEMCGFHVGKWFIKTTLVDKTWARLMSFSSTCEVKYQQKEIKLNPRRFPKPSSWI